MIRVSFIEYDNGTTLKQYLSVCAYIHERLVGKLDNDRVLEKHVILDKIQDNTVRSIPGVAE